MRSVTKEQIAQCIEANYQDHEFSVARLSELVVHCESGVRDFSNVFFGVTPRELIEIRRLSKALDLLTDNIEYKQICVRCGYASQVTFYRAFTKKFDLTPLEWRQKFLRARQGHEFLAQSIQRLHQPLDFNPFISGRRRARKSSALFIE